MARITAVARQSAMASRRSAATFPLVKNYALQALNQWGIAVVFHFNEWDHNIGEIHGRLHSLRRFLRKLGQSPDEDVWNHEDRRVPFLVYYIDRGGRPRETLPTVRRGF